MSFKELFIKPKESKEERSINQKLEVVSDNCSCADSLSFFSLLKEQYSYRTISSVYACVEKISNALATMPLRVVRDDGTGHMEIVKHHPLQRIFRGKNKQTVPLFNIIKAMMTDVLMKGNGYIYINRGVSGEVISLRYLPAGDVSIMYDERKDTLYYLDSKLTSKKISPDSIIHITKNTKEGISGVSVLNYARDVLDLAKAAEKSAQEFFESGMNINGILSCATMLNEKQRNDIRQSWSMGGGKTSLQILPANVSYQQIGTDAAKAQLLESREYETIEVARYFDMPAQLIQSGEKITYSNLEQLNLLFLQHTLLPYIACIEGEFTRKIFADDDDLAVDFDENAFILRTDKTSTQSYLAGLVNSGLMTPNEARSELGLPQVPGGDNLSVAYSDISQNTINNTENLTDK